MLFHRTGDTIHPISAEVNNDISLESDFIVGSDGPILRDAMVSPNNQSEVPSLQDYLRREAQSQGINHEDIAERAQADGHKISAGYVNNMMNGYALNPSSKKIRALAAGLGKEPEELFAIVGGKKPPENEDFTKSFFYAMWRDFKQLPNEEQPHYRKSLEMIHQSITRLVKAGRKKR